MLPWRHKIERWLGQDRQDDAIIRLTGWLVKHGKRMDEMAELLDAVKKELAELKDAVVANKSAVEQLRKAYEYLRDHPKVIEVIKEDPALAAVATEIDGLTKDLADSVAKAGASGGV